MVLLFAVSRFSPRLVLFVTWMGRRFAATLGGALALFYVLCVAAAAVAYRSVWCGVLVLVRALVLMLAVPLAARTKRQRATPIERRADVDSRGEADARLLAPHLLRDVNQVLSRDAEHLHDLAAGAGEAESIDADALSVEAHVGRPRGRDGSLDGDASAA